MCVCTCVVRIRFQMILLSAYDILAKKNYFVQGIGCHYILLIKNAWQRFGILKGKEKKVCLALLLMKISFIIPMMTSNFESYIYISYISWFLSGLFVHMISVKTESANTPLQPVDSLLAGT